jgi:hypothetical protein
MFQALTWMIRLPTAVILTGVEAFKKALEELQQLLDQGVHIAAVTVNDITQSKPAGCEMETFQKEDQTMIDQDLSGDDLKYVTYSVLFTKRDYEATLEQQREYIVNYATDGASFASLRMIRFASYPFERPAKWRVNSNLYPPDIPADQATLTVADIPEDDQKYITFIYNVERRLCREDKDYEKRTVEVLGQIRDRL